MSTNAKRIIVVACFVAAFLAGAALDAALGRRPHRGRGPHFEEELGLSKEQSQKMRDIWSTAMDESRKLADEGFERIRTDRDKAIRELVAGEGLARYEEILAREAAARKDLETKRREFFDRAIEQTRGILDDKQKVKYDELIAKRRVRHESAPWSLRP
jgi:Spy/CpxP family protein refolding chaperone